MFALLLGVALAAIDPPPVYTIPRGEVPTGVGPLANPKGKP